MIRAGPGRRRRRARGRRLRRGPRHRHLARRSHRGACAGGRAGSPAARSAPAGDRLGQDQHRPPRGGRRHRRPDQGRARPPARGDPAAPALPDAQSAHRLGGAARCGSRQSRRRGLGGRAAIAGGQLVRLQRHERPRRRGGGAGRGAGRRRGDERARHLLPLSATTEGALRGAGRALRRQLASATRRWRSRTSATRRGPAGRTSSHRWRVAETEAAAQPALAARRRGPSRPGRSDGQGPARGPPRSWLSSSPGRGRSTRAWGGSCTTTQPTFRRALEQCDAMLAGGMLERPLLAVMYRGGGRTGRCWTRPRTRSRRSSRWSMRWRELWRSWGIEPRGDGAQRRGVRRRPAWPGSSRSRRGCGSSPRAGRLMQALPAGGAMAAVLRRRGAGAGGTGAVRGRVAMAAVNGPEQRGDLGGGGRRCGRSCAELARRGVRSQRLRVSHAFHSPLMEPMLRRFETVAAGLRYGAPAGAR